MERLAVVKTKLIRTNTRAEQVFQYSLGNFVLSSLSPDGISISILTADPFLEGKLLIIRVSEVRHSPIPDPGTVVTETRETILQEDIIRLRSQQRLSLMKFVLLHVTGWKLF